jgi:DeoR/GlpR family transcriptional regulator of sugar metabolism
LISDGLFGKIERSSERGTVIRGGQVLAQQRQASILDRVRRQGGARVADLVRVLGVSDMTIRRDIEVLAERGLVAKVHGGAVAVEGATDEPGYATKSAQQLVEKAAIARAGARLVKEGSAVGISAGTTTAALARELTDVAELTVVTNSIPVADVFYHHGRRDQTVVLTGGTRTPSDALVGPVAQDAAARINLDMLFLGVHGMSPQAGFTTPNLSEADTNRALVAATRRLVVLADHTKWDLVGFATIAALADAHILISDSGLPRLAREELAGQVGDLIIADEGGAGEPER